MLVFLSWSGDRSKAVADALSTWLSQVIQATEPWLSRDIAKGARWGPEVADRLEKSKVGIVCLTPENLDERWILFEAGALSKTKNARVCTFLLDLKPVDVEEPLSQFQHTQANKEDMKRLVQTINQAVHANAEKSLTDSILEEVFETNWPRVAECFEKIRASAPSVPDKIRSERELLEEILEMLRRQERRASYEWHSYKWHPSPSALEVVRNVLAHAEGQTVVNRLSKLFEPDLDKPIREALVRELLLRSSKLDLLAGLGQPPVTEKPTGSADAGGERAEIPPKETELK